MTKEMLEKAKNAKTSDELMAMANAAGIELEKSKAEEIFARLNKGGELSDDDLDSVAGGMYMPYDPRNTDINNVQGGECHGPVANIKM